MPIVRVGDLDVYHEVHGTGERVLLISGTGGDVRSNPRRGRGVLEQRFEVLMYDQRGLGQTSKPDRPYTMGDYADDAVALMDALGWERAHVVGISFGGMVAQHVALRHPDRVDRLVLACTSSGGAGGSSFDLLSVVDLPRDERALVTLPIMDTRNDLSTDPPTYAPMFDVVAPIMAAPPLNADDPDAAMGATPARSPRRPRHVGRPAAPPPPDVRRRGPLRRAGTAREPRAPHRAAARRPDAALRRRPPVPPAGRDGVAGDRRLPRRRGGLTCTHRRSARISMPCASGREPLLRTAWPNSASTTTRG